MRNGNAIKAAIKTTLQMTWAAAKQTRRLDNLVVRFAGTGASMTRNNHDISVNLPDFLGSKAYSDAHADRIVAMALHEIGHGFFTIDAAWDDVVFANDRDPLLHRCINAFEDVRMERALIDSGFAVGARKLLPVLLAHMTKDVKPETFDDKANIPFAICVNGRGYGIDVLPLVRDPVFLSIIEQGIARCAGLRSTADAAGAGLWLWRLLKQLDVAPPDQPTQPDQPDDGDKPDTPTEDGEQGEDGDEPTEGGDKGDEPTDGEGEGEGDGEGDGEGESVIKVGDRVLCPDGKIGTVQSIDASGNTIVDFS